MRDLVLFVRQLWEDRLQSVEEFTKENNLSLEEALQVRQIWLLLWGKWVVSDHPDITMGEFIFQHAMGR